MQGFGFILVPREKEGESLEWKRKSNCVWYQNWLLKLQMNVRVGPSGGVFLGSESSNGERGWSDISGVRCDCVEEKSWLRRRSSFWSCCFPINTFLLWMKVEYHLLSWHPLSAFSFLFRINCKFVLSLLLQCLRDKDGEGLIHPDERRSLQAAQTRKQGEFPDLELLPFSFTS